MKKGFVLILLISIILLGIISRFYKIGEAPAGLYIDEAGQGYSAFSILKTGKDEFGKPFPIVFRAFTDFKTPIYIYSIVPLIPLFGLTPFTVRLPSAFFGVLTLPILFLLIRKISPSFIATPLAIICMLLLAISPWHVLFSRTDYECNIALFLFLSGIYLFYLGLEKPKFFILSAIFFATAIPAYHAQRVITPLTILILFIKHHHQLSQKQYRSSLGLGFIIAFLISIPTLLVATTPGFLARAGLNIFSSARGLPAGFINDYSGFFSPIINSRIFLSVQEFLALYFSYLSPRYMFVLGDYGPRSSYPELSTFFIWQFPFYIYGLILLIKEKRLKELRFLTIVLLLLTPIPAAITRDPYSTIRALPLVVPQIVIISLGIFYSSKSLYNFAKEKKIKIPIIKSGFALIVIFIISYSLLKLHSSVILLNEYYRANEWDSGWKQVSETIKTFNPSLPIIVDHPESYIELLFFLKYPPEIYQKENFEIPLAEYYTNLNRNTTKKIGNIQTRPVNWREDLPIEQYLIGDELAISEQQIKEHNLTLIREIDFPNSRVAFRILKTNPH